MPQKFFTFDLRMRRWIILAKKITMARLLIFILLPIFSSAQSFVIRGKIIDSGSGEPVIAATVGVKNSFQGAISNDEGMFQLSVQKGQAIAISSMGYKGREIPVTEFDSALTEIRLEPDNQILEEVIVTGMPIEELLKKVVRTSKARFNKPILLSTYYREFSKLNDKTTKFADGILDYYVSGKGKTTTDLIVRQSRAARITTPDDDFDPDTFMHLQKRIATNYELSFLEKVLLKGNRHLHYDLSLRSRKTEQGKDVYVIGIQPKPETTQPLFTGSISFDPETKIIYAYDLRFADSYKQFSKQLSILGYKIRLLDQDIRSTYALVNGHYYLLYSSAGGRVSIFNKRKGLDEVISAKSDLITIDFARDAPGYDKNGIYRGKNLYARGNRYSEPFWNKGGAMIMTAEEEAIIKKLEKEAAQKVPQP